MRKIGLGCVLASLVACGGGSNPASGDDVVEPDAPVEPQARGFKIVSKEVEIPVGEITYCYYFRTPNTEPLAIHKWSSTMTPGSHHMIMYTTGTTDVMPPGTLSAGECGLGTGGLSNQPAWTYAAQTQIAELELPNDDGTGMPLAQDIAPNTAGYFQMHYLNATENPITVHVELTAEALDAGVAYTKTAPYITYNDDIRIPAATNNVVATKTCQTPAGAKFWMMSTHAHKQAVKTEVDNSGDIAFQSTDWEHPGTQEWMTAPFYTFANNQLSWSCTYDNAGNQQIVSGPSAQTNEMCMATGYYFPATGPKFCYCPANTAGCFAL